MRFLNRVLLTFGLLLATTLVAQHVQAQTKSDVIKTFNEAYEYAKKGDNQQAIDTFQKCIQQADQVGAPASDIKQKAQEQLAPLHYKLAADYYRQQKMSESIQAFKDAMQVAEKYGNKDIAERCKENIPKLYYAKGNMEYMNGDYQNALQDYDNSLKLDPNNAKPYYQKGLTYKNMDKGNKNVDKLQDALNMWDQAIKVGQKSQDNLTVRQAKRAASDFLVYKGAKASGAKSYKTAIELLKKSLNYDTTNPNAYYRLAETYNKVNAPHDALKYGDLALKYEKGGKTDKAKIWYEIGTAHKNLKEKKEACSAFEQAAYGAFKQIADHELKYDLKCPGYTQNN